MNKLILIILLAAASLAHANTQAELNELAELPTNPQE
jgi:hypothetical protein